MEWNDRNIVRRDRKFWRLRAFLRRCEREKRKRIPIMSFLYGIIHTGNEF